MFRRIATRISSIANMPLFGTRVIPRDATVDPTLFSEEEYPVHCPKCGYLLRGLPDGNCPECGKLFERGRLLVQQYVHDWSGKLWRQSKAGMWCMRLFGLGFVLYVAALVVLLCCAIPGSRSTARPATLAADNLNLAVSLVVISLMLVGTAILFVAAVRLLVTYPLDAHKRRRAIIDAIARTLGG